MCRGFPLPRLAQQPLFSWHPLLSHQTVMGWEMQRWAPPPKGRTFLGLPTRDSKSALDGVRPQSRIRVETPCVTTGWAQSGSAGGWKVGEEVAVAPDGTWRRMDLSLGGQKAR